MNGLSVSLNLIIVVAIAVLIIAVFSVLFINSSAGPISQTEAQSTVGSRCSSFCKPYIHDTFRNALIASRNDPNFMASCNVLGYPEVIECIENICLCDVDVTEAEIGQMLDEALTISGRR